MSARPRQGHPVNVQETLRRSKRLIEKFAEKEADEEPRAKIPKCDTSSSASRTYSRKSSKRKLTTSPTTQEAISVSSEEELATTSTALKVKGGTQSSKGKAIKGKQNLRKSSSASPASRSTLVFSRNPDKLVYNVAGVSKSVSGDITKGKTGQPVSKSEGGPSTGQQPTTGHSGGKQQEGSSDSKTITSESQSFRSRLRSLSKRKREKSSKDADRADSEPQVGSQQSATIEKDTGCSSSCCQGLLADGTANNPGVELLSSSTISEAGQASSLTGRSESQDVSGSNQSPQASADTSQSRITSTAADEGGDLARLHALLEARGLRPELLDALGARGMHHIFCRLPPGSGSSGTMTRINQLMTGIEATHDETLQLQSVIELCQLLVMGNEDTLGCFPIKQAVPALMQLMIIEHNLDMMNHACRALTYMMEALPRSSAVVVDAIPVFLEKLQVIQCMDVAEQALTALEMLSRRHGKAILKAGGINACLLYLDFFSINAQRAAVTVAANCCQFVTVDDFPLVIDCVPILSARLQNNDKKSVESSCLCFARLVDSVHSEEKFLVELAGHGLLANLQQLVVITPPIITTNTFTMVIRMLHMMCSHCPPLAVQLLKQNMADTVRYLLVGTSDYTTGESLELVSRSPGELYELVALISAMLPSLPSDGIFSIDALVKSTEGSAQDQSMWQWKDDNSVWHLYSRADSHVIELAFQAGEEEVGLTIMGRNYAIDFLAMQQINEDSGTSRTVQRRAAVNKAASSGVSTSKAEKPVEDDRNAAFTEDNEIAATFVKSLFPTLYCVYNSSAGPGIRHKCVSGLLRMLYFSSPEVLNDVLEVYPVSSQIAALLGSRDQKVVVSALQMAHILMDKLPEVFRIYFRKEGVVHEIEKLAAVTGGPSGVASSTSSATASASTAINDERESGGAKDEEARKQELLSSATYSPPMKRRRLSDILRRRHARQSSKDEPSPPPPRASSVELPSKGSSVVRAFLFGKKLKESGASKTKSSGSGSGSVKHAEDRQPHIYSQLHASACLTSGSGFHTGIGGSSDSSKGSSEPGVTSTNVHLDAEISPLQMNAVAMKAGDKWYEFGLYLKVDMAELKDIRIKHSNSLSDRLRDVLRKWHSQSGEKATVGKLLDICYKVEVYETARKALQSVS